MVFEHFTHLEQNANRMSVNRAFFTTFCSEVCLEPVCQVSAVPLQIKPFQLHLENQTPAPSTLSSLKILRYADIVDIFKLFPP